MDRGGIPEDCSSGEEDLDKCLVRDLEREGVGMCSGWLVWRIRGRCSTDSKRQGVSVSWW